MSYKITIINNENGEVIANEENAVAIVGAIGNEDTTHALGLTECNGKQLFCALSAVEKVKKGLLENHPEIELMLMIKELKDE